MNYDVFDRNGLPLQVGDAVVNTWVRGGLVHEARGVITEIVQSGQVCDIILTITGWVRGDSLAYTESIMCGCCLDSDKFLANAPQDYLVLLQAAAWQDPKTLGVEIPFVDIEQ
jgi:hypothetical protein